MKRDELSASILETVRPPIPPAQWDDRAHGVFSVLFGAAVAILYDRELIEGHFHTLERVPMWEPSTVWQDFDAQFGGNAPMLWDSTPDLSVWSVGFFLNRSQQNIAAALDRMINSLLSLQFGIPLGREDEAGYLQLYCTWVGVRCQLLSVVGLNAGLLAHIRELEGSLGLGGTDTAKQCMATLARTCKGADLEETLALTRRFAKPDGTALTDSDCVAVAWGLNNAFKHQVLGAGRREGSGHLVSWCVLARAVMFVGRFWQEFVRTTGKQATGTK